MTYPFDRSGITRGPDGIARYDGLPGSVVAMLRATVDRSPAADAVAEAGGEHVDYRGLWDAAARVAGGLRAQGVGRGDRVAVRLPNGLPWVLAYLGTLLAGGVAVPVNTRFTSEEAAYVVDDSGATVVLDSPDLPSSTPYADESLGRDDLAALFYTSGTTGFPKGARTTHGNLLSIVESTRRIRGYGHDAVGERNLVSVPLFHVTGCNSQLVSMLYVGGCAVVLPRFSVGAFLDALERERVTMSTAVPAIYWLMLNAAEFGRRDLSALRILSYGGAPIAPELVARLRAALPGVRLGNGYGLSEAASVVTYLPDEFADARPETVGFPIPVDDLRLDVDGEGPGELLVRGPNVVDGYWNKAAETAAAFRDGWLHTGDVAMIDGDGFVTVLDRVKDMINRGGENVYSLEVENVLAAHEAVGEVAVVAVPDEVMGEKVGAVLVPAGGALDVPALLTYAREHLADFKVPEYVAVLDEPLPRNPGGKVLKRTLAGDVRWRSTREV